MASRSLDDLHPMFAPKARGWVQDCKEVGLDVLVYCTLRSDAEQDELYAQGRTKPGRIVTYAKAGQSAHNYGLALDFVPLINGKPDWRAGSDAYIHAIQLAQARGMESAAMWKKFKEYPHLQQPFWRTHL